MIIKISKRALTALEVRADRVREARQGTIGSFLGARGALRRGGAPFDAANRGRSQRFNKFEGQQAPSSNNESGSFDQSGEGWSNEVGARSGRGRGGPRRVNFDGVRGRGGYEGGRGTGGRGRGGNFNNRTNEDGTQQENNRWQQNAEYVEAPTRERQTHVRLSLARTSTVLVHSPIKTTIRRRRLKSEPTTSTAAGVAVAATSVVDPTTTIAPIPRAKAAKRTTERIAVSSTVNHAPISRKLTTLSRLHDLVLPFHSGVKPIEKKDGEGAHNWGNPTENPEDHPISE